MKASLRKAEICGSPIKVVRNRKMLLWHGSTSMPENAGSVVHLGTAQERELLSNVITWERGGLSETDTLAFFQNLVASGLAWKCTGPARRTAARLLREGAIQRSD